MRSRSGVDDRIISRSHQALISKPSSPAPTQLLLALGLLFLPAFKQAVGNRWTLRHKVWRGVTQLQQRLVLRLRLCDMA